MAPRGYGVPLAETRPTEAELASPLISVSVILASSGEELETTLRASEKCVRLKARLFELSEHVPPPCVTRMFLGNVEACDERVFSEIEVEQGATLSLQWDRSSAITITLKAIGRQIQALVWPQEMVHNVLARLLLDQGLYMDDVAQCMYDRYMIWCVSTSGGRTLTVEIDTLVAESGLCDGAILSQGDLVCRI